MLHSAVRLKNKIFSFHLTIHVVKKWVMKRRVLVVEKYKSNHKSQSMVGGIPVNSDAEDSIDRTETDGVVDGQPEIT